MKKLALNKQVIARLNNPENIYGGMPITYESNTKPNYPELSAFFDKEGNNRGGITGCTSGPNSLCMLTHMWNCPSVDPPQYCN